MALRLLSYLAPSVPAPLFEAIAAHLGTALHVDVELSFDASRSGPRPGERRALEAARADVAFVCATSYVWMTAGAVGDAALVGAAWVPLDPRAGGRPVYFGDVLAPAGGPRQLGELLGRRVAYNDEVSLSGYHSLRLALAGTGLSVDQVELVRSGSHLRSLELLMAGSVDAAAVDSNVWRRLQRESSHEVTALRRIAELGPHPVQPVVARTGLAPDVRDAIRSALLFAHTEPAMATALRTAELARFAAVTDADYRPLRSQLAALGLDGSIAG